MTGKVDIEKRLQLLNVNVPIEMQSLPQWVVCKLVERDDGRKPDKIPISPVTGRGASTTNPRTWGTFEQACNYLEEYSVLQHKHIGKGGAELLGHLVTLGFVFAETDPYAGIDGDSCVGADGKIKPWAREMLEACRSWSEYSLTDGVHAIVKARVPKGTHKKVNGREIGAFSNGRYFALTGKMVNGHREIAEGQAFVDKLVASMSGGHKKEANGAEYAEDKNVDAETVMDRVGRSKKSEYILALLNGELDDKYTSRSERDLALINFLVFFSGKTSLDNYRRIVTDIISKSSIHYEKTARPDYIKTTVEKALEGRTEFWKSLKEHVLENTAYIDSEMARCGITSAEVLDAAYLEQQGCADLARRLFEELYCYDHAANIWYHFQKHFWRRECVNSPLREVETVQAIFKKEAVLVEVKIEEKEKALLQTIAAGDTSTQEKIKGEIKTLESKKRVLSGQVRKLYYLPYRKTVIEFTAQGPGSLGISGDEWDQGAMRLGCLNGVLDLKTGSLAPGRPVDYIKSPAPTAYDPKATCPQFEAFLLEIFDGNKDIVDFLQVVLGMGLIGDSFQKPFLIILSGRGRNGKDTLVSIICHTLGPHLAGGIRPEMLLDGGKNSQRSSSGPSADIMRLRGLRQAFANETSQGQRFDSGTAKMLTGGGTLVGRSPYGKREVEFQQSHLIFLMTNHRPHAPVDDYAFWKRIRCIEFPMAFVDNPQEPHERKVDRSLPEKLRAEAEGVLRWMVEGCLRFQKEGLRIPDAVRQANEDYRRSEDTLQDFIDEECETGPSLTCTSEGLYRSYKGWSERSGVRPMSKRSLGLEMTRRGFGRGRSVVIGKKKTIYHGITTTEGDEWTL
jgi:putative DNA primase/helicase